MSADFESALERARATRSFAPLAEWGKRANISPEQWDVIATLPFGDEALEDQARAQIKYQELRAVHGIKSQSQRTEMIRALWPRLTDNQIIEHVINRRSRRVNARADEIQNPRNFMGVSDDD